MKDSAIESHKILTPEEMEAEKARKQAIAARFGGNIRNGGRPKSHATVIREMMEGEFASVTEKNMKGIANKLLEMIHSEDGNDRRFALKTLIDANNKIIDRAIEENKDNNGEQLIVNVNRGGVTITKGKDTVKVNVPENEDTLRSRNKEVFEYVKNLEDPPQDLIDSMGYEKACDFWHTGGEWEEVEDEQHN
jgi:hypothetical protein